MQSPNIDSIRLESFGIGEAIATKVLTVPRYQRPYAWDEENVIDLFQDISGAISYSKDVEYFLGSVVVARGERNLEIIDGQQRLATITILLAALRDYFYAEGKTRRASNIETKYLLTENERTLDTQPKLTLNRIDNEFFYRSILVNPSSPERQNSNPLKESHKKLYKAFQIATQRVKQLADLTGNPEDSLMDWVEYIRDKVRVMWLTVPDYSNAFIIFETLNDRGLDLTISDLLKNYLLGRAGTHRIDEVQENWTSMIGALEAVGLENKLVTYIRHLWSSEYGLTREKELYSEIKRRISSVQDVVEFSSKLADKARLYAAMQNPNHPFWNEYSSTVKEYIETLNYLRVEQYTPLLLAILSKFPSSEIKKSLRILVSWIVRFLVSGGGGGTLENAYSDRAAKITRVEILTTDQLIKSMVDIIPNDKRFQADFAKVVVTKNYLARYYLRALEKQEQNQSQPETIPNDNEEQINLEHVLPENPSDDWREYISLEDAAYYWQRLGNMALLQGKKNSSIGNQSFEVKKDKAFKLSTLKLTQMIAYYDRWGTEEIDKRQRQLAELAVKVWPSKI